MVLYGAASAALAWLDQADSRQRAAGARVAGLRRQRHRRRLRGQGRRRLLLQLLDGRPRPPRGAGAADRSVRTRPRAVGGVLRPPLHRPAAVTGQQRRRPGAAGGLGDRRRHRPRVADRGRLCGPARLHRCRPGPGVRDRGAARRLPARPAGQAAAHRVAPQPGGARAAVARRRRSLRRSPHRQGVPGRGPRGGQVPQRRRSALSHQHERDLGAVAAAAADGGARRSGHRRRLWYGSTRLPPDGSRRASSPRSSRRCC